MAWVPLIQKSRGRHPSLEAMPAGRRSSPPERLFGFVDDVAPGQADVVQVAGGQLGQQAPVALALVPDLESLADPGKNAGLMMIYHRLMGQGGHGHLLK